jgi:A/G-specific adenine glycosylase
MTSKKQNKKTHVSLAKALLQWFQKHARDLPWRKPRTPYRVWLSEMMLQQTRVDTVVPYFEKFLHHWPTLAHLANASLDEVLKEWAGMGYYSRARYLHRAAQIMVCDHGGKIPRKHEEIKNLPGVGEYTAGAIASLAFNQRQVAVDGNVVRVFGRLLAKKFNQNLPKDRKIIEAEILNVMPQKNTGLFNEALMELGATICTSKNPLCLKCPIKKYCLGFSKGNPEDYPGKKPPTKIRSETFGLAIIQNKGKVLIQKNKTDRLLADLWGFPTIQIQKNSPSEKTVNQKIQATIKSSLGITLKKEDSLPIFQHRFSHILMTLYPQKFSVKIPSSKSQNIKNKRGNPLSWVPLNQLDQYALSKAHRRVADLLIDQ